MTTGMSLASLALLLLTVFTSPRDRVKPTQLEGLNITMTLERRSPTTQQIDWPSEPITLQSQSVSVDGRTIHQLLMANHIFPDVEAFGIVYALNPGLRQLKNLSVPQVRIPVVRGGAGLTASFRNGYSVFLTSDKDVKDRFVANVNELAGLAQSVSGFGAEKFQSQPVKEATVNSLKSISTTLTRIRNRITQRHGRPIPGGVLSQLNAEIELVNGILRGKGVSEGQFGVEEQMQIAAVEKDVTVKGSAFIEVAAWAPPERWPEVNVTVKTLRGSGEIPSLRIYYVPQALKKRASEIRSFGVLSSPSKQSIPEADYCFWASRDPDTTAVTNEQCIEVRTNRQAEVQLTVIR